MPSTPYPSAGDWNRELSKPQDHDAALPIVQKDARILCLSRPNDPANARLYQEQAERIIGIGTKREDFDWTALAKNPPTVVFVSTGGIRDLLAEVLTTFATSIQWVHAKMAGIEHCTSPTLSQSEVVMTNAKGHFSSTLAEYGMMACSYFAKDLPRLLKQKANANWEKYNVLELRGATLGIIGYGDIGQATARLAKAYGMNVMALKRKRKSKTENGDNNNDNNNKKRKLEEEDENGATIYYSSENPNALNDICAASDYIYVSTPLTPQTKGMIGKEQFNKMKSTGVIINVGRGPVIDEEALIEALKDGKIKGAALDVTSTEPLPKESPLWGLDNVLLSP